MSVHKDCGEPIRWARRDDDLERFAPPVEYAGPAFILADNGTLQQVNTYRHHRCDPEKIVAWQEYISQVADLKGPDSHEAQINVYQAASERDREEAWKIAELVDCSVCPAVMHEKCINMSVHLKKTGEIRETRNPHPQRLEAGYEYKRQAGGE